MSRRKIFWLLNLFLLACLLQFNNCRLQTPSSKGQESKEGTIIGNPMTELKVASFVPLSNSMELEICVVSLTLFHEDIATMVEFPTPVAKLITNGGVSFGEIQIPAGEYSSIHVDLDDSCGLQKSLRVKNSHGEFSTQLQAFLKFDGTVGIANSNNRVTFNIQSVFDRLETVTANSELIAKAEDVLGLASSPDRWGSLNIGQAPEGRASHASVWTGRELIVWGGYSTGVYYQNGGRYDPSTDQWRPISQRGAPSPRYVGGSVWTGTKMFVWGGADDRGNVFNTGGLYDPATDSWQSTSIQGIQGRDGHTTIWTGSRVLIWGGQDERGRKLNSGLVYDPATDTWTDISTTGAPSGRIAHTAVWTGSEMLVWGGCTERQSGCAGTNPGLNDGARYNPATNAWTPISMSNAPSTRYGHTAIWTGSEMIIWSGNHFEQPYGAYLVGDGGRYNPASNSWIAFEEDSAITPRVEGVAVWTGSMMLVWGGRDLNFTDLNSSALFDPTTNSWTPISAQNAPAPRRFSSAVWTGFEIVLWGGRRSSGQTDYLNSGGRYRP